MEMETTNNMYFEAQINNLYFRYSGDNVIEVSKVGDKQRTVLHEIHVKELKTKKEFDMEISFWFMKYGSTI